MAELPARFTARDRLRSFPTENSRGILAKFSTGSEAADRAAIETIFDQLGAKVLRLDRTDGLRVTFTNEEVIHLRPSGNAPEFRCYTQAATNDRVLALNGSVLGRVKQLAATM